MEHFFRIDHILGHKIGLNKYKKIEDIPCTFSDHKVMKLEINHKKKSGKFTNIWRLKNMLLNNEWVSQKIKEEKKKNTWKKMKMKIQWSKILGYRKSGPKSEIHNTGLR